MKLARPAALAAVAVLGMAACTSNPGPEAVARDFIESIGLEPEQEQCMLEKLDSYSDETLTSIGEANLDVNFDQSNAVEEASPAFQEFVADLQECMGGTGSG